MMVLLVSQNLDVGHDGIMVQACSPFPAAVIKKNQLAAAINCLWCSIERPPQQSGM